MKAIKYTGMFSFRITAVAGFFAANVIGTLALLGIASPPRLAVSLGWQYLCLVGFFLIFI